MEIKIHTDELMSVVQTAKELNKPRLTIYRWIEANKLIGVKLGGILFIPTSEVERVKKEQAADPGNTPVLKEC